MSSDVESPPKGPDITNKAIIKHAVGSNPIIIEGATPPQRLITR